MPQKFKTITTIFVLKNYSFTPLDPDCVDYVQFLPPETRNAKRAIKRIDKMIEEISAFFHFLIETAEQLPHPSTKSISPFSLTNTFPHINFCSQKILNYQTKLYNLKDKIYRKKATVVSHLLCFFYDCKENGAPVEIQFEEFKANLLQKIKEDPEILKLEDKIIRLKSYCRERAKFPRFPKVPIEHVKEMIHDTSRSVISGLDYAPPGFFDTFLLSYVVSNDRLKEVDNIVTKIIQTQSSTPSSDPNDYGLSHSSPFSYSYSGSLREALVHNTKLRKLKKVKFNTKIIAKFVSDFSQSFSPQTQEELYVINCSVIRLLFDRLYVYEPSVLTIQYDLELFDAKCRSIREATPLKLNIESKFFVPSMMSQSFTSFLSESKFLKDAIQNMSAIQFYTSPIDIVAEIFHSLKQTENFVRMNNIISMYGEDGLNMDTSKVKTESSQMTLDDFLSVFAPVFCLRPPVNAMAISNFLTSLNNMKLAPQFDFAKAIFTSVVEYVQTFNQTTLFDEVSQLVISDDEENPLFIQAQEINLDNQEKLDKQEQENESNEEHLNKQKEEQANALNEEQLDKQKEEKGNELNEKQENEINEEQLDKRKEEQENESHVE